MFKTHYSPNKVHMWAGFRLLTPVLNSWPTLSWYLISFNQPTAIHFLSLTVLANCFRSALPKGLRICAHESSRDSVKMQEWILIWKDLGKDLSFAFLANSHVMLLWTTLWEVRLQRTLSSLEIYLKISHLSLSLPPTITRIDPLFFNAPAVS